MFKDTKAFSGFSVDDTEAAKRFYGETLGIRVTEDTGPGQLSLHLAGGERPTFIYTKDDHRPATFTILNFPVEDIDAAVGELASRGVEFERYEEMAEHTEESGIVRGGGGPPIAWFKDPAGNILSVLELE